MTKEILTLTGLIVAVFLVRMVFKNRVSKRLVFCLWLAVLLVVSAAGCSSVELTQQKSSEITLPEETEEAPGIDQTDAEYDDVKT